MNRLLLILMPLFALATPAIVMERVQERTMGKVLGTNAQIIQLSNQKQKIVSRLPGHIERYFVAPGDHVKRGKRVALIESISLSKMTAEYVALQQQVKAAKAQRETAQKLYAKGLLSQNELNEKRIATQTLLSKQNTLASQLRSLGINLAALKEATDKFTLYAHADGVVGEIYLPLHANVDAQAPIMSIVNQQGYYAIAYLSVADAMQVTPQTEGVVTIAGQHYKSTFVQLLPAVDTKTQRAKLLFRMREHPTPTLLNAFAPMQIALPSTQKALMVKRTALTLFGGEWVVFVKKEHEEHEEEAEEHNAEEEEGHEHEHEHEHTEVPYAPQVVKVVAYYGDTVAIKGLEKGEAYVSDGVYFVKSMLLKSSLGEHGH